MKKVKIKTQDPVLGIGTEIPLSGKMYRVDSISGRKTKTVLLSPINGGSSITVSFSDVEKVLFPV